MSSTRAENSVHDRYVAISAAATVFAQKGYHDASLEDIASCMGVGIDEVRACFASKGEALQVVCLFGMRDFVERMHSIATSDQSFDAKLVAVVTFHVNKYCEKNEALRVYHAERLALPEKERVNLQRLGDSYRDHLIDIFAEGIESGSVRKSIDCKFAAQAVIGMCDRWGQVAASNPDLDLAEVIENCIDLLINGFMDRVGSDSISIDL